MSDTKTSPQPADAADDSGAKANPFLVDADAAERLSTAPVEEADTQAGMGVLGWLRWFWRQLTSMRVALLLLFLLSLAAIPGSLVPQEGPDTMKVVAWKEAHQGVTPLFERLELFNVYSSKWFSAIYILLFISLAGCILPRTWQFVGVLRSKPPAAPRNLTRMPVYAAWHTAADPEAVNDAAYRLLKKRGFRTAAGQGSVAAEKGYLREVGNLLFHFSLFALLVGVAWAGVASGTASKLVLEGQGYSNTTTQIDDFYGSYYYGVNDLDAFGFKLDGFTARYQESGPQIGTARQFTANVRYWVGDDSTKLKKSTIEVNHPLEVGDSKVYLIGHGYAPVVTVKNAKNEIVYRGPTPFLPRDANMTSPGVIKVNDYGADANGNKTQLAFQGFFLPTAPENFEKTGPISMFPAAADPMLVLTAYAGDLRTDSGLPQNVYQLDDKAMTQLKVGDDIARARLKVGQGWELPNGYGTITFDGYQQWATFTVSHHPGNSVALVGAVAAILGLIGSLFVQRRRIWVRATTASDGRTLVEVAGLGRSESARTAEELADLAVELQDDAPASEDPPGSDTAGTDTDDAVPAAADSPAAATPTAPETKE
ncbi:cytochrome c biogenesis protein ResB [Kitasatospora cheerisanensis]|uniref:Cytochrome C biosynthesis protein n=1 Tax=Kitasatospora cheerisanensis KCTC 2395 TaxID=1348663 RepID=A0A066Z3Y4_9ACTN|nr:cytochrome c biogenesis protein ResB [Kitasatospora cheerisanensis]KDN84880.1 cytochrome C biosynthesis protein [Kitasatospora cheerisanensis KCTC 2395]